MKLSSKLKNIHSLDTRPEEFPGLNKMREEYCYARIDHIEAVNAIVRLMDYCDKAENFPENTKEAAAIFRKVVDNES